MWPQNASHKIRVNHKEKNGDGMVQKADQEPRGPGDQGYQHVPLRSCSEKSTVSFLLSFRPEGMPESGNVDGSYLKDILQKDRSLFFFRLRHVACRILVP